MPADHYHRDSSPAANRNNRHVYFAIVAWLLVSLLLAVAATGPRYFRAYGTIKKQFEAEQEYVDRVKKEAERRRAKLAHLPL